MRKSLIMLTVLIVVCAMPAMAARVVVTPISHPTTEVYQSYPGNSEGTNLPFRGYDGLGTDLISSAGGILSIVPGENWANFVSAAQANVPYAVKNVVLTKQTPTIVQCADLFPTRTINQQGTANIRLWWPLMYEVPSTTWTLSILYGTYTAWDDDGAGPNPPSYVHQDIWQWHLAASLESMQYLLELFHELPFGTSEAPLISDEALYPVLQAKLDAIIAAVESQNPILAGDILADFEMEVADACIGTLPMSPSPNGPGTGIALTDENPACCKLMADAEYVGKNLGIWIPKK